MSLTALVVTNVIFVVGFVMLNDFGNGGVV